jgi:hypothetical protein
MQTPFVDCCSYSVSPSLVCGFDAECLRNVKGYDRTVGDGGDGRRGVCRGKARASGLLADGVSMAEVSPHDSANICSVSHCKHT